MTIDEQIYGLLSGIAALATIVGARIYPVVGPENEEYAGPYVVWRRVSNVSSESLAGPSGYAETRYQFSLVARGEDGGFKTTRAMCEAIRLGITGYVGGSIQDICQEMDHDTYDPNYAAYVTIADFKVSYGEAQP